MAARRGLIHKPIDEARGTTPKDEGGLRTPTDYLRRKPGRNDPCWCGSGKTYKTRHLRQDAP